MGFDNECIINIQSLAGEYFCPVCRTLVYPNEALQSQCTHLYCKPCLTYVVGTTKACPYDGYLVTEVDSKPLIESNKALAEAIGKILVHCLFHRSGCMWQGPLSECTSHCSGCAFGNSPVVCNRCMIQIVHRQVQEHAQNCPGANPQVQQVTGSLKDAAFSGTVASANPSQTSTQPGAHTFEAQVSQTSAAPPPAQDPNKQANANAQAQAVAPAAVLTTEQWYQQQYQQYYQQYPGYDPYQQSYQQYYPYQQQSTQQLQQHPPHVQGQQQPQVYPQPFTQLQSQHPPHSQQPPPPQPQPQTQLQPQQQTQLQPQQQTQLQPQPYAQQQPPSQHQPQIPPQGQPQSLPYVQNQVNPQQQPNPGLHPHPQPQPQPQPQSQTQQPAHGHMPPQQQPYPQVQLHPQAQSVQPQLQQHLPAPQYQQSHPQGHQVQLQLQHSQPQLQHPVQQTQSQNHPQLHPPLPNQPQSQQLASHAVAGHHLYPPVQAHQQTQPWAPQQHPMHMHPPSGSLPHAQVHIQFPQPPLQMRPPQAHTSLPNHQQPNLLQSQGQVLSVPPAQQNQIRPLPQQQVHPVHQHPVLQPMQQPLQPYGQQPPFPVQVSGLVQGPLHQQVPMQSQSRPQGPPQSLQHSSLSLPPPPYSGVLAQGMPPHPSQAYVGRPVASNHAAVTQPFPQSSGAFGVAAQLRPMQLGSGQPSGQLYASKTTNQQVSSEQQLAQSGLATFVEGSVAEGETGSPSQKTPGQDVSGFGVNSTGVKDLNSERGEKFADNDHKITSEGETNGSQDETPDKGADTEVDAVKDGIQKIVKEEGSNGNLDPSSGGKLVEIATLDGKGDTAANTELVEYSSVDDSSSRQAEALVGQKKDAMNVSAQEKNLSQGQVTSQGSAVDDFGGFQGKGFMHSSQLVAPSDQGRHRLPLMPYGPSSQQQRPVAPSILPSGPLPGPPSTALVPGQGPIQLRPHASGHLPPPQQSLNPPEHLQQPGSFQDNIPFGGGPTPGLRGTDQFGHHPQGSFELQPSAPQGQYNQSHLRPSQAGFPRTSQGELAGGLAPSAGPPGSFDPQGGVMGRAPPYGPEGWRPFNPVKSEMFQNQRPHHFDGRHPDFHGSGSLERGQFGQPSAHESNLPTMPGPDSTFASGLPDERFKTVNEEHLNSFLSGPTRRLDQGEFEEVPKQFHTKPSNMGTEPSPKFGSSFSSSRAIDLPPHEYNYDAGLKMDRGGGAPSRFLPPYHTAGAFHSSDAGERQPQSGLHEDNRGRGDFGRTQPDFHGSGPEFGRHQMDRLTTRSPGREYHGIPPRGFGGFSGGPLNQSALNDIDGRDTHSFGEGSRSFNLSSDPVGNSFRDDRFPVLPGQVRRRDFDGPGNFGMSEHFRNGDMTGQDFMPNHSNRGEFLGPRNVPSHMRVGDDFGAFSVSRMGELPGAGGFPIGEPFGGNKLNHPRVGEPGFRSGYSLHEFPTDGGFYAGNSDSFDRLRKRMPASTGWCRICKVDCETVEGLDLHSQTREHQKMTMDMVISIKQHNAKRQKTSKGHSSVGEGSRSRNAGIRGRGNKP